MKENNSIASGYYKPLKEEDARLIHETSLRVLREVGVEVNFDEARALFKKAGANVDEETRTVKIPSDLVAELIGKAPSTVMLHGRGDNGEYDCEIGGANVYLGTGGTALNVQDPGSDSSRRARLDDIVNMARTVQELENIHFYMLNVYPDELPVELIDVNRFGAAFNSTRKHVMGGVYTREGVKNVIRMAEIIAGSPEKLRNEPFLSFVTCSISPFKLDEQYGKLAIEAVRHGVPLVVPSEPLCGATAPVTLAGNLVVQTVDTLAGVMLAQLVSPGAPVLMGCVASSVDLRDMKYLSGAVEMGLLNAAAAQMAQYYDLPVYTTAGMSDSKINDVQSGFESALTSAMVALAGGNCIHDAAGFLEFCMTASYDKLVIDNEINGMIMRAVSGIEVNEKTLAFDLIKQVGPGGHFVSTRHTRRYMRREHYQPTLSDRNDREMWKSEGAKDTLKRATERVTGILNKEHEPVLSTDLRARILAEVPDIKVAGFSDEVNGLSAPATAAAAG
jgi:trimethylamine---corrinoid protein Co-methyltransferase